MPHILQRPEDHIGKTYLDPTGSSECVEFIKRTLGAPETAKWREGAKITASCLVVPLPKGAAIATFASGKYPQGASVNARDRHAAILLAQTNDGIEVLEQFSGQSVHRRTIRWQPVSAGRANIATGFSLIEW